MGTLITFPGSGRRATPPFAPSAGPAPAAFLPLPVRDTHPAGTMRDAPPFHATRASRMTVTDLAQRLALDRHTPRVILDKLRSLARHSGLPLPLNPRIVDGVPKSGPDKICAASLWDRGQILAWLDHGGTPGTGTPEAAEPARIQRTREHLQQRTAALLGGGAQRRAGA